LLDVWLPVAHQQGSVLLLCGLGLGVGFLAGFFGVGGGVIMTPMLMALGVPPHVAVGSGLTIMVGASISGTIRHTQLGNVDFKLALLLLVGSFMGVQVGASVLGALSEWSVGSGAHLGAQGGALVLGVLKGAGSSPIRRGPVDAAHVCLSICYMVLLFTIGISTLLESRPSPAANPALHAPSAFALRLRALTFPPYVSLPSSGVARFPFVFILVGGLLVGVMAGLLGVGGGIFMLPFMMYFVGMRAQRAVGTSLCQICFTAAVGAASHAFRGNVDPILAAVVLTGSLVGARLGASTTSRVHSRNLRQYFGLFALAVGLLVGITFIRETLFRH